MLVEDIGSYLESCGLGVQGVDIFLDEMPPDPDDCMAVFGYAGSPPDLHWSGEYPGLQVRVRNRDPALGRAKAEQVRNALHGLHERVIGTTRYLLVRANQSPEPLGKDGNGRAHFVINFSVIKEIG
ncbi:MAG: hypothetical protein H5U02_00605 [Clostridia bacterium]|nr:hypothetical protein [Clostridia bacterium]